MINQNTLEQTTKDWVASQGNWVDDPALQPAVRQLLLIAVGIDQDPTKASLHSQFGLTWRSLMDHKPKEQEVEDELDLLLRRSHENV